MRLFGLLLAVAIPFSAAVPSFQRRQALSNGGACKPTYNGRFQLSIGGEADTGTATPSQQSGGGSHSNSSLPACTAGFLTLTLSNGSLFDQDGRFAYIAAGNNQFQFDNPVQAGGYGQFSFSLCNNGTIALNGSADWFQCDSGAGFFNLYNADIAPPACQACKFLAIACT